MTWNIPGDDSHSESDSLPSFICNRTIYNNIYYSTASFILDETTVLVLRCAQFLRQPVRERKEKQSIWEKKLNSEINWQIDLRKD